MADLGYISKQRALEGEQRGLGLKLSDTYFERRQPYFFDYVEDKLIEKYGVNTVRKGGLKVYTTIDPRLQEVGLEAMNSALPYSEDPASALVSIEPETGYIRAMVSSSSYDVSQFNLAAQGHRQPGSTFKTFVLTTAIKQGVDPYSTYYTSKPLDLDLPEWGHWEVHTADEGYLGTVNLQQATVASDNTVFAQLDLDVGPENVAETAKSMGIESELDGIPAEGIGGLRIGVSPLEMSDAYATLAAGGIHRNPTAIRRVVFPDGRVDRPEHPDPKRVVSEAVAYEVTRLLHDNITGGTGTAAYTGCAGQAGKTGTTDNYTDAWFAGYQPNLSTVVWVGYPQSNDIEMSSVHGITVFGGTFPAEIWNSLYSNGEIPCEEFSEPETPITWAPFYGQYTSSAGAGSSTKLGEGDEEEGTGGMRPGQGAVGGYDPNAYAPGVGQDADADPPPAPSPSPPSGGGRRQRRGRRRHRNRRCRGWLSTPGPIGPSGSRAWPASFWRRSRWWRRGRDWCRRRSAAVRLAARDLWKWFRGRPGRLLRAPLGGVRRPPLRSDRGAGARSPADPGRRRRPRDRLRAGPAAALPGRLQLHRLRPPRRPPRPQPLHPRAEALSDPASPTSAGPNRRAPTARCSRSRPIRSP